MKGCLSAFIVIIAFAVSAHASPIYKYVDEDGTVAYTDQHQLIPDKYRERTTVVNPETLSPAPSSALEHGAAYASSQRVQKGPRFSAETLGVPLARGIVGILLFAISVQLVRRVAGREMMSGGFVKSVVVLIILGSLYEVYLAEKFAGMEGETAGWHIRTAVSRNVSRLKAEVEQTIDRPLKPVRETVQKANAAVSKEEEALRQINSDLPPDSLQ